MLRIFTIRLRKMLTICLSNIIKRSIFKSRFLQSGIFNFCSAGDGIARSCNYYLKLPTADQYVPVYVYVLDLFGFFSKLGENFIDA